MEKKHVKINENEMSFERNDVLTIQEMTAIVGGNADGGGDDGDEPINPPWPD